ncbi:MAG: hypothetical protein HQL32_02890 [Planctomycetes bacterium]|nr:hypothetical protein [Planctomycetota bacterium]
MNLKHCLLREMGLRPLGWVLGVIALTVASASILGAMTMLHKHDKQSEKLISDLQQRAETRMDNLNKEARIFSKNLGFNTLLLPKGQDLARFWENNSSDKHMSSEQAGKIGAVDLATLNHLLPILRHRHQWDLYGGLVNIVGIQGEIYIKNPAKQKVLEQEIASGTLVLGHGIAEKLNKKPGDRVELFEREFEVFRVIEKKGNADDFSLLMNLGDLQKKLNLSGKISGLMALSCECAGDGVELIEQELRQKGFNNLQVVGFTVRSRVRMKARRVIMETANAEKADIEKSRRALRAEVHTFAFILISLVSVSAALLVFVMTVTNARERRSEVAILRAHGVSRSQITQLFMGKSLITGLGGGILGAVIGALCLNWQTGSFTSLGGTPFFWVVAVSVGISVIASALPSLVAASTSPATILNQDS